MNLYSLLKLLKVDNNRNYISKLFFASLSVTFIFTNSSYLLIYFSDTINIYEKLLLLANQKVLYIKPISISLLFTFFSIILNIIFYKLTLLDMKFKQNTTERIIDIKNQEINLIKHPMDKKIEREREKLYKEQEYKGYII